MSNHHMLNARCDICLSMMHAPEYFRHERHKDWPHICEDCSSYWLTQNVLLQRERIEKLEWRLSIAENALSWYGSTTPFLGYAGVVKFANRVNRLKSLMKSLSPSKLIDSAKCLFGKERNEL